MYKTRTAGTKRLERDLRSEVPLGVLEKGWHTATLRNISVSSTSLTCNAVDSNGDKMDTRVFIRDFADPTSINTRMKALLSAVCMDSNELMTLADAVIDGEFHMLGSLDGRKLRVEVGDNGDDLDIIKFSRCNTPKKTLNF